MTMLRRIARMMCVLAAASCGVAFALPPITLTLIPAGGVVQGAAGQTAGWGFSLVNNTPYYLLVDGSNFCGTGGDPDFTDCATPYNPPTEYGPRFGTYNDFIASNVTIIPPFSTVTQDYNFASMQGVGDYVILTGTPTGSIDPGNIFVSFQEYSGNPLQGGMQVSGDMEISAPATVQVTEFLSPTDAVQVNYAANLKVGDSVVNLTSTADNDICANVYVYDPNQEMISCCSCLLTPNDLRSLSAQQDLTSNSLTPGLKTAVTIKLVGSAPLADGTCNPSAPNLNTLATGLRAWGTTLHAVASGYALTEREFEQVPMKPAALPIVMQLCQFIQQDGSGYGICNACRPGAMGAGKQ